MEKKKKKNNNNKQTLTNCREMQGKLSIVGKKTSN